MLLGVKAPRKRGQLCRVGWPSFHPAPTRGPTARGERASDELPRGRLQIPSDGLTPLIARAVDFARAGMALIDELRSAGESAVTLPEWTVVRLHFVAASTFHSGLLCLWMPETSLAASGLIRGLLEVWSHLIFISDDTEGGDARCRALRYERGALREWTDTVLKAPGYLDTASWQANHDERQRDFDKMWKEFGCKGQLRTRSQVFATLAAVAKEPTMEWIPGVWSASSASNHAYGVDFMLDARGTNTRLVWALPSQRASWLALLVAAYDYLTVTGATILARGDARIDAFQAAAGALLHDDVLVRINNKEFDG